MASAASMCFTVSILAGVRRARAAGELRGDTMRLGLSMTVMCLSKGTACMILKQERNSGSAGDRDGLSGGYKTEHEAQGWIEQAQHRQSDPVYHHLLHVYVRSSVPSLF